MRPTRPYAQMPLMAPTPLAPLVILCTRPSAAKGLVPACNASAWESRSLPAAPSQSAGAWLTHSPPDFDDRTLILSIHLRKNLACSTLFVGQNTRGTLVYSWVSPTDQTSFDEDITPLLQYLWRNDLVSADARIGLVEFGSEAYHAGNNVTFSAGDFSMDLWPGTPVKYELNPVADHCDAPQSPAGPQGTSSPEKGIGARAGEAPSAGLIMVTAVMLSFVASLDLYGL